ncbi:MAG: histidine kinase [Flavobacteriales bacterium]
MREHIARDLHDEIGSTLSSVALYGAVARKKLANIGPEGGRLLERISEAPPAPWNPSTTSYGP